MAIFLYSDFGSADVYVGQVKATLQQHAAGVAVIDLLHDAPAFNVKASAHLLAALAQQLPVRSVVLAVVDPGVGSERRAVALHADERWYVGPDNGLLSVTASRASSYELYTIAWRPRELSASFHGRDLFAPVAGMLASAAVAAGTLKRQSAGLEVDFGAGDIPEVIYIDHYGNAMTGIRADRVDRTRKLQLGTRHLNHARVFAEVKPGGLFWYENSLRLVEIAANGRSAARALKVRVGQPVQVT
ncbi:MAG: SAM hydrolase/SAM-dependent halogenase family protein [Betaproteobacteria bacterium]